MTPAIDPQRNRFTTAFSSALANGLSQFTVAGWTVQQTPKAETPGTARPAQVYRLVLDGSLKGDCFVELNRSEWLGIAAKILGEEATEFADEHGEALLEMLGAAVKEFAGSLTSSYGPVTVKIEPAAETPSGQGDVVWLLASDGAEGHSSVRLHLSHRLVESLQAIRETPPVSAKSPVRPEPVITTEPNLNLVLDVELNVMLRFGQRTLALRDVLELATGSVIELDRQVEEPVELLLDGRVIARGEAVIVDGNYGLRVTELPQLTPDPLGR
jgi:flagellar motor switch protein FliN